MSQADRTVNTVETFLHSLSHYGSPDEVLRDARLSTNEKRVILSSWASDMYAVDCHPALREIPGIPHRLRLEEILAALKELDDDNDPPPRGGVAMRLPLSNNLDCTASGQPQRIPGGCVLKSGPRARHASRAPYHSRWTSEENVRRYRRLLNTQLTDFERSFVERRLAEELHECSVPLATMEGTDVCKL